MNIINNVFNLIKIMKEEKWSKKWLYNHCRFYKDVEKAFVVSDMKGWGFDNWALSKGALRILSGSVINRSKEVKNSLNIVELGGGQSTLFWKYLIENNIINATVTTFEHDETFASELQKQVFSNNRVNIIKCKLKQISNTERDKLFEDPLKSYQIWNDIGTIVNKKDSLNTRLPNAFYQFTGDNPLISNIDILVVDGPHGNGRSLAFPLFCKNIKQDTLILIDDFDHYSFLQELGRVFKYEEVNRYISNKHWVLVKVIANNL